jgi:thiol-disulfide isomerase/thioredoxin
MMKSMTSLLVLIACAGMMGTLWAADDLIRPLPTGAQAPDFLLPATDGSNYSLKDFASARILAIVFTANHCPTAEAYEDRLIQLVKDYRDRGVAFVAIAPNDPLALRLDELGYTDLGDTLAEMKIRARDKGFNFPYLYDGETQKTSRLYGPVSTPHVFIFNRERKLCYNGHIDNAEKIGAATRHDLRNALEAMLAGKAVPVEITKTFGCSIKWSDKREGARLYHESLDKEPVTLETIDEAGVRNLARNDSKKFRLINVWATWCAPCLVEIPELVTINRMYRGREFELITISADAPDGKDKVLTALQGKKAALRNYLFHKEDNDALSMALDKDWPGGFPYTLLIAPGGKVLHRQMGEFDSLKLKKAVVEALGRFYP